MPKCNLNANLVINKDQMKGKSIYRRSKIYGEDYGENVIITRGREKKCRH